MANSLNIELEEKTIVLDPKKYKGDVKERLFKCTDGFGCSPNTRGTAIYGIFLSDKSNARISGFDILRLATDEECDIK
jgi:hypothetical protein